MQPGAVSVLCLAFTLTAIGCVDRDPFSASDVAAADAFQAKQAAIALRGSRESGGPRSAASVRCRCDAEGGLHVHAPAGSEVVPVSGATSEDAEAEITLADRRPGRPIRQTISLGFIGDNKLDESPSRHHGDALLPPHEHGVPDRPYGYGHGYYGSTGYRGAPGYGVSRGYAGHVPRYASGSGAPRGGGAPSGGSSLIASPQVHTSGWSGPSPGSGGGSTGGTYVPSGRGPR